ncbi:MAG: YigZ family protein [Mycoplasmatales bacterium]
MNTIIRDTTNEIVINKSRFITKTNYVEDEISAKNFIESVKNKFPDARHHCYVYRIGNIVRVSDDGEPSGTAGIPMLEVIKHHDINNIVIVVIRYFGGIKLGAGGLTRAYTKSVSKLILNVKLEKIISGKTISIEFEHAFINKINYYLDLNNIEVLNKKYNLKVVYSFNLSERDFDRVIEDINQINHLIKIKVINEKINIIENSLNDY